MISQRLARNPKHRSLFHEARYNLALCRFKLAMSKSGTEQKAVLEQAKKEIDIVERLYPKMGGDQWKPKYEKLREDIKRFLN